MWKDIAYPAVCLRHRVRVSRDHVATVQFQASKQDVHIKLSVLDHEREVASKTGQGHVVIPLYSFSASDGLSNGHMFTHTHTIKR